MQDADVSVGARTRSARRGRIAQVLGTALLIAAFGYLAAKLAAIDPEALGKIDRGAVGAAAAGGVVAYTLAGLILALSWSWLLRCCTGGKGRLGAAAEVYAVTQALKYLPGNVMHVLARQAAAMRLGVGQAGMAMAGATEIASLVAMATALAAVALGPELLLNQLGLSSSPLALSAVLVAGATGVAVAVVAIRRRIDWRSLAKGAWLASFGHLAFFAVAGAIVLSLAGAAGAHGSLGPVQATGLMALAWIVGFVVPGAPAGLGVREAALVTLLEPSIGLDAAAASALLFRIVTLSGDGLLAVGALALRPGARGVLGCQPTPRSPGRTCRHPD